MKYSIRTISLLLIIAVAFLGAGCSNFSGPSDDDVIKAIDESGILKGAGFTVAAPIVVVEKGKRSKDGTWPVKIKLTMTMDMGNGKTTTRVTTPIFSIHKSTDSAGKTVWTATVGTTM